MKYVIKNDNLSSPLQFIFENGRVVGQFYNSKDKTYHLAEYLPYKSPPKQYLCKKSGNFSASRETFLERKICLKCFEHLTSHGAGE